MKKISLSILTAAMLACFALAVCSVNLTARAVTPLSDGSYALYVSDALATELGGKTFSWLDSDNAVITHDGVKIRRSLNLNVASDGTFYENAGSLGETPADTVWHQVYGYPEIYFSGIPGPITTGFECSFTESISVADFSLITFETGFKLVDNDRAKLRGSEKPFTAYVYLYGSNGVKNVQVLAKTFSFGIEFFTTAIIDLDGSGLTSVSRMAVAVDFTPYNQVGEDSGVLALEGGDLLVITNVNVHEKTETAEEKTLTAQNNDVYFFNGGCVAGVLENSEVCRVYRTNGPQVWFGQGGIPNEDYKYCTPRISTGDYVIMYFREPVNVNDYKFFDARLMIWPQVAEGDILQETATDFIVTALKAEAADLDGGYQIHFAGCTWQTCRIPLADFADDDGYVTKILFYYADNDAYGHGDNGQEKYNVNFAMYDGALTNYEETELIVTYIAAPTRNRAENTWNFNLKSTVEFAYGEEMSETFKAAIKFNGQTLTELIADGKAKVVLNGYFIKLSVDASVMKLDNTDSVEIVKDAVVRGNLKTVDNEKFIYSYDLHRFELVPDRDAFKDSEAGIGIELAETGNVDALDYFDAGQLPCNSIWTTFNGTVTAMSLGLVHQSLEKLTETSGNTDIYNYHLAKRGVFESVMDYLYVNGKSMREWMTIDRADGRDGYIRMIFLSSEFNDGKTFVVQAANGSALELGVGKDMSIEFKKGFTTSSGLCFQRDVKYRISGEDATGPNCWFSATSDDYPVTPYSGCGGSIVALLPVAVAAIAVACAIAVRRITRKENA